MGFKVGDSVVILDEKLEEVCIPQEMAGQKGIVSMAETCKNPLYEVAVPGYNFDYCYRADQLELSDG
jgi:hypothetical protein